MLDYPSCLTGKNTELYWCQNLVSSPKKISGIFATLSVTINTGEVN